MIKLVLTFLNLFFIVSICFTQTNSDTVIAEHYKTRKFDVAIFPTNSYYILPGHSFKPSRSDVDKAENALREKLKELNKNLMNQSSTPVIHKNLHKYKRQYFGYIDNNGHRILFINCFWAKDKDFKEIWLKARVIVLDGGSYYWRVKFNLDTGELFELDINGYA